MFLVDILSGGYDAVEIILILLAFALSVTIAITLHEFAHAFAALKAGDPSAKLAGRLSINPAAHLEPVGLLCFLLAGIGWAKPVPVNPFNYRNFKHGNFWVSISGVLTNLVIGFIASFFYYLIAAYGGGGILMFGLGWFFALLMIINLSLAVFNLLPIPPLDGYNMLVSFTKPDNRFMRGMRENSMIFLMIFVLFGGFVIFAIRGFLMDSFLSLWGAII